MRKELLIGIKEIAIVDNIKDRIADVVFSRGLVDIFLTAYKITENEFEVTLSIDDLEEKRSKTYVGNFVSILKRYIEYLSALVEENKSDVLCLPYDRNTYDMSFMISSQENSKNAFNHLVVTIEGTSNEIKELLNFYDELFPNTNSLSSDGYAAVKQVC